MNTTLKKKLTSAEQRLQELGNRRPGTA